MKESAYVEGVEAQRNFEEGMKALFRVPKAAVVKAEKKQAKKRAASRAVRKSNVSDKD